jgi:hypothetical protein
MATKNVPRSVTPLGGQEASAPFNIPANTTSRSKDSIQSIWERLGFHAWEGSNDFTETWESPTVLILKGTMEMASSSGLLLKVPFSCRIEFGEYSLEIENVKVTGFTA